MNIILMEFRADPGGGRSLVMFEPPLAKDDMALWLHVYRCPVLVACSVRPKVRLSEDR